MSVNTCILSTSWWLTSQLMERNNVEKQISVEILPDGRLNTEHAARYLGYSTRTMALWRVAGEGPKYVKLGRVFYYKDDLDAWINERARMMSTSQAGYVK